MDRRRALGLGAAGAAAAWVAPQVLSVEAAAAATVLPPGLSGAFGNEGNPGAVGLPVQIPPQSLRDGDLLLAAAGIRFSDAKDAGVAPPPGFLPVVPNPALPDPGGVTSQPTPIDPSPEALRGYAWYRFWNTGDPTSFAFQKTVASGMPTLWSAAILVIRNASGVGAAAGQGQVGLSVTAPSITTTVNNSRVYFIGITSGPTTWTAPGGFTTLGQGPTNPGNPEGLLAELAVPASGTVVGPVSAMITAPSDPAVNDNLGFLVEILT